MTIIYITYDSNRGDLLIAEKSIDTTLEAERVAAQGFWVTSGRHRRYIPPTAIIEVRVNR